MTADFMVKSENKHPINSYIHRFWKTCLNRREIIALDV